MIPSFFQPLRRMPLHSPWSTVAQSLCPHNQVVPDAFPHHLPVASQLPLCSTRILKRHFKYSFAKCDLVCGCWVPSDDDFFRVIARSPVRHVGVGIGVATPHSGYPVGFAASTQRQRISYANDTACGLRCFWRPLQSHHNINHGKISRTKASFPPPPSPPYPASSCIPRAEQNK